jgi:predicted DNA-binding protein
LPCKSHWLTTHLMAKKDFQIGIRMPMELRDELRSLAQAEERTLSSYIVRVLQAHVSKVKKRSS